MKKTDMELQAIRDKLKQLESEPPAGDVLSMPWSAPQTPFSSAVHTAQTSAKPATSSQASQVKSPQAAAMATLRQRSISQGGSLPAGHTGNQPSSRQPTGEANRRAQALVAQEIERLEIHARNINQRSQEQTAEILAMKSSAQQAVVALRRQGIDDPQLKTIAQFLEQYPSASVPYLDRDSQGHFTLSHNTINLHHAEQEAVETANALRNNHRRSTGGSRAQSDQSWSSAPVPFSQPVTPGPSLDQYFDESVSAAAQGRRPRPKKQPMSALLNLMLQIKKSHQSLLKQPVLAGSFTASTPDQFGVSENGIAQKSVSQNKTNQNRIGQNLTTAHQNKASKGFSWMDGAIWLSTAAITRIVLEAIVLSYPIVRMPLMVVLFSVISLSIYRVFVSKSSDPTPAYRLGVVLLGLFLGSAF